MDSIIIAAGLGSRIRGLFSSKPLAVICGLTLLEIAARQLVSVGVRRIIVVTGYRAEEVEAALPDIAAKTGAEIEAVRAEDYSLANGHSVLAGAARVSGSYLLVMADHILSAEILNSLVQSEAPDRGVTLAVDRHLDNPMIDPNDATYVCVSPDGRITRIGKNVRPADAVDCGAFLATPELARAIGAAIDAGMPGSLSDGMQWLADRGRAATVDIGRAWWIDVDDPAAHAMAEQAAAERLPHLWAAA